MTKQPDQADVGDVIAAVPGVPNDGRAPVFAEPWQAQAFAMALSLQQKGVFTWTEWAEALGDEISKARTAGDADDGSTYYHHWMATLERLVDEKGLASSGTLEKYSRAWGRAADRTPHGRPIALQPADFE